MLFQDHGGLIMMVLLCSPLTCSGSLLFLFIFPPAPAYSLDWLYGSIASYKCNVWSEISFTSFQKKKKKVTVACGIMFIDKLRDKCARVTPTAKCSSQQKKISHGQNIKDTCAGVHCADMLYMSLILQAIPSSVSAELWRLQWLPITWQR